MRLGLSSRIRRKRKRKIRYPRESVIRIRLWVSFLLLFLVLSVSVWFLLLMRPVVLEVAEDMAGDVMVNVINKAVYEEIEQNSEMYKDLVKYEKDEEGKVNLVNTDTIKINALKSRIISRVCDKINDYDVVTVEVPIGAALHLDLFYTLGPKIKFNMISTGFVDADFVSEFIDAGINQTNHIINVLVEAEFGVVGKMGHRAMKVKTNIPVSHSVIVGDVPKGLVTY